MKIALSLNDYHLLLGTRDADGLVAQVWHQYPAPKGNGMLTPVGFVLGMYCEAEDIRPARWEVELFLRDCVHYDEARSILTVAQGGAAAPPHYHQKLPEAIRSALVKHTACEPPISMTTSLYRQVTWMQLGETWLDDD